MLKRVWRKMRGPIARSRFVKTCIAYLAYIIMRAIYASNPFVRGSDKIDEKMRADNPSILVSWHGQHLMLSCIKPRKIPLAAMISRSNDAEINAKVLELGSIIPVRGSGGRAGRNGANKGGASALLKLKTFLDKDYWVGMIADIPKGTPRDAGMGVITLARISQKPIVPVAYASKRRHIIAKSWDKTTIPLPFSKSSILFGEPIYVPATSNEETMEAKRRELSDALDVTFARAYQMVDGDQ